MISQIMTNILAARVTLPYPKSKFSLLIVQVGAFRCRITRLTDVSKLINGKAHPGHWCWYYNTSTICRSTHVILPPAPHRLSTSVSLTRKVVSGPQIATMLIQNTLSLWHHLCVLSQGQPIFQIHDSACFPLGRCEWWCRFTWMNRDM
jgi:hypothetical protein